MSFRQAVGLRSQHQVATSCQVSKVVRVAWSFGHAVVLAPALGSMWIVWGWVHCEGSLHGGTMLDEEGVGCAPMVPMCKQIPPSTQETSPQNQKMSPIQVGLLSAPPAIQGQSTPPFRALCRSGLDVEVDTHRNCLESSAPPAIQGQSTATRGPCLDLLLHSPW